MGNSNTLQLLNEVEKEIETYLFEFQIADSIDPLTVLKDSKTIQIDVRKKNREEKLTYEKLENEEKQRKKQEEKNAKKFVKIGRPNMKRSNKPEIKKEKQEK